MVDRARNSWGFTVAELIVAMSISAVTLLSGYELFQTLKTVGDRQSADLTARAGIVHGLGRIRDDLLHAVPRVRSREPIFMGGGPGLDDEAESTKLLAFYSLCAGPGRDGFTGLRQMHRVSYELTRAGDSIAIYRSTDPVVGAGPTSADDDRELILDRVEQLRIAFHDGRTSEPSFSSKEELPMAVELTVAAYGQVWPMLVALPCGTSEGQP